MEYIIGIDEVGRGPIAGPVVVCACAIQQGADVLSLFPKSVLKDSKKLSEKKRLEIRQNLESYITSKIVIYGIGEVSAQNIDVSGISAAIKAAMHQALEQLHAQGVARSSFVFLDGSLHAPEMYQQETIIKGDEKIQEIALASIIAKVYRDDLMKTVGVTLPEYGFENHVGYGTKAHYGAITQHGLTPYHRKSFLSRIL